MGRCKGRTSNSKKLIEALRLNLTKQMNQRSLRFQRNKSDSMPLPGKRVEGRQKVLVNAGFLALLTLIILVVTTLYISSERNFHWWIDWYYPAIQISDGLRNSPSDAIELLKTSLTQERNRLYVLPLVPLFWAFGNSRLVYEIGLALVYLLPLPLVMGAIAAQLIQTHRQIVFWATAFLML